MRPVWRFLSDSRVFSLVLLWLMVILVAGTIAEKTSGLYAAEQRYFSSALIWAWNLVPLPGLPITAGFIFLGLIARLALEAWAWRNAGTIVIHIGAALLLFGGFVTMILSRDGLMVIPQGETRDYMEDTHHVELAISELHGDDIAAEKVIPETDLARRDFSHARLPFGIESVSWCGNCALLRLSSPLTEGSPHGVAINFVLKPIPADPDDGKNRAGLTFRISGTEDRNGLYAIFEDMPIREIVTVEGKRYWLSLRRERTALPFAIRLRHFTEDIYPGTDKPRSYQSDIVVEDRGILWPSSIRMNEPLHYKGYTFYQSSFLQGNGEGTTTVLAVVKNAGRLLPYLSGGVMAFGFLLHLFPRLGLRNRKNPL